MWDLKMSQTNLTTKEKESQTQIRLESAKGEGWEFGISRCKRLYIRWINNQVLLYSTGKYSQYPVINQDVKEHEKEYMYHFAAQQKLMQH